MLPLSLISIKRGNNVHNITSSTSSRGLGFSNNPPSNHLEDTIIKLSSIPIPTDHSPPTEAQMIGNIGNQMIDTTMIDENDGKPSTHTHPLSPSPLHLSQYLPLSPHPTKSTIAMCVSTLSPYFATTHGDHTVKVISTSTFRVEKNLKGHPRTPWCAKVRMERSEGKGRRHMNVLAYLPPL